MKKSLIGIIGVTCVLLFSCGEQEIKEIALDKKSEVISKTKEVLTVETEELFVEAKEEQGVFESLNTNDFCFVGAFEANDYNGVGMRSNKITIQLVSITSDSLVFGHSIVAGNLRPFSGNGFFNEKIGGMVLDVKEPGDDKYDGEFSFVLKDSILRGQWYSYDKNLLVNQREFRLKKTKFNYDANLTVNAEWLPLNEHGKVRRLKEIDEETGEEYYYEDLVETLTEASTLNASIKELKKEDLENLYKTDLEIIRNAIYARHGYSFKNRKIRNIFDEYVDWYIPFSIDVSKELTDLEIKNITLIKRYEKHAETYYDAFGR
jgi:hypothetical protein